MKNFNVVSQTARGLIFEFNMAEARLEPGGGGGLLYGTDGDARRKFRI